MFAQRQKKGPSPLSSRTIFQKNSYILDTTEYLKNPAEPERQFLLEKYLKNGQSSTDIGKEIGRSKAYILKRLKSFEINTSPKHRHKPHPHYGYTWKGQTLIPYKSEQKIIDQIKCLFSQRFNYAQIAKILNAQSHRSKEGVPWQRWSVRKVFERETAKNAA